MNGSPEFPYSTVAPAAKWSRSVAGLSPEEINPHLGPDFQIKPTDRIASAGSCFAQRIADALQAARYNYLVTEPAPAIVPASRARHLSYGVYSARFGNIYTTLQLNQLFDRAFGSLSTTEPLWKNADGGTIDPYRPGVQPGGFLDEHECLRDRALHLAAVRRMFEEMDVFIFTLGLTEVWLSGSDGSALPACPGSPLGGIYDPVRYAFRNLDVSENVQLMRDFLAKLKAVNERAKVILTVSPVPLAATFEPRHVLQSTVYSKSVLRVTCEEIVKEFDHVSYFASYEIVTHSGDSQRYFKSDRRTVASDAVLQVIKCFHQQYTRYGSAEVPPAADAGLGLSDEPAPIEDLSEPMCDENLIFAALAKDA